MLRRRSDLPLEKDPSSRFLPWLIAFMVYLSALAVAGAMAIDEMVGAWQAGATRTITVQLPPLDGAETEAGAEDARVRAVLGALRAMPGVIHAVALPRERVLELLEPWLGPPENLADFPIPHLIDVDVSDPVAVGAETIRDRLAPIAGDFSVDDHGLWLDRLVRLARSVEALAIGVVGLIGIVTIGTVVFTTRAGLAVHQSVVEVLHLIGAHDDYVARQFGRHAMMLGLKGGLIGLVLAVPTLMGIGALTQSLEAGLLPTVSLGVREWAALAALPVVAALIARITARFTVSRALKRML